MAQKTKWAELTPEEKKKVAECADDDELVESTKAINEPYTDDEMRAWFEGDPQSFYDDKVI